MCVYCLAYIVFTSTSVSFGKLNPLNSIGRKLVRFVLLVFDNANKFISRPLSMNLRTIQHVEYTSSFNHVIPKISLVLFPIAQQEHSLSKLIILKKTTIVVHPVLF